jgi:micrococcal nuclease
MKLLLLPVLILLLIFSISCTETDYAGVLVVRVNDGDTFTLQNGERVRLIGIDTPEYWESDKLYRDAQRTGQSIRAIQEMGKRAYKFTRQLVEGKRVRLEFDSEKRDKYGRLLAYVYLDLSNKDIKPKTGIYYDNNADGSISIFVNASIVKSGYASLMTIPPDVKYANLFRRLYREAKQNKRGLWK